MALQPLCTLSFNLSSSISFLLLVTAKYRPCSASIVSTSSLAVLKVSLGVPPDDLTVSVPFVGCWPVVVHCESCIYIHCFPGLFGILVLLRGMFLCLMTALIGLC